MNKDTLFKHVVAMGDKSTHGEYKSQAMTDMHQEGFEREFCRFPFDFYADRNADGDYEVESMRSRWEGWCAALRYRDEQEKQA